VRGNDGSLQHVFACRMMIARAFVLLLLVTGSATAQDQQPVQITQKPLGLVHGDLYVPVTTRMEVERVDLLINGLKHSELRGRSMVFKVPIGKYLRRLRIRAVGFDASGGLVGDDEVVINDPQPPFRVRLHIPPSLPERGHAEMSATVTAPRTLRLLGVDFFVGEQNIGTDNEPPYTIAFDVASAPTASYVRAVARTAHGEEANDVRFWGSAPFEHVEVNLQQIPLSVSSPLRQRLTAGDLRVYDNGAERSIEGVVPASDLPLSIILLIDSSESMLEELPTLQRAAKEFARSLIRPQDRIAVVGFHERLFWLTGFTSDLQAVDQAIDRLKPLGQTHLYDSVIAMLFELQKMPGRRALVVLSDGVNQGGDFRLEHLVHYARYSGVPVYPIIKNAILSRLMRFGIGRLEARRFAGIARETGATYFIIERADQLPSVYRRIAEELRQQYLMIFYAEGSGTDVWHTLRVDPARKGLTLRAPTGYFP
jgi:VWFA-related protein